MAIKVYIYIYTVVTVVTYSYYRMLLEVTASSPWKKIESKVLLQMFAKFCSCSIAYCTFSVRIDLVKDHKGMLDLFYG